jgi:hypothetical protein
MVVRVDRESIDGSPALRWVPFPEMQALLFQDFQINRDAWPVLASGP